MGIKLNILAVTTLFLTASANAAIITFTDRNDWRAATGGGIGDLSEDFSSFSGVTNYANPTGVNVGFLNFSVASASYIGDASWSIRDRDLGGAITVNGSSYVSLVSYNNSGDTLITHSNIGAFGLTTVVQAARKMLLTP